MYSLERSVDSHLFQRSIKYILVLFQMKYLSVYFAVVGAFQKGQGIRFIFQIVAWLVCFPVLINNCIISNLKLLTRLLKHERKVLQKPDTVCQVSKALTP